jgi:hypothetical protein
MNIGLTLKSHLTPDEIMETQRVGLIYNPHKLTLSIKVGDEMPMRHEYHHYINQYKRVRLESLYNKYNDDFHCYS